MLFFSFFYSLLARARLIAKEPIKLRSKKRKDEGASITDDGAPLLWSGRYIVCVWLIGEVGLVGRMEEETSLEETA